MIATSRVGIGPGWSCALALAANEAVRHMANMLSRPIMCEPPFGRLHQIPACLLYRSSDALQPATRRRLSLCPVQAVRSSSILRAAMTDTRIVTRSTATSARRRSGRRSRWGVVGRQRRRGVPCGRGARIEQSRPDAAYFRRKILGVNPNSGPCAARRRTPPHQEPGGDSGSHYR